MKNLTKKYKKIIILLVFLFLISAFLAWLFYRRSKQVSLKLQKMTPNKTIRINPNQAILTELEKRLDLPKGNPFIFNLSDLAGLINQPFFKNAKPTDKLIIFQEEKKAVLFDPITQKIVNIGPLFIVPATQEAEISAVKNLVEEKSATQSAE